MLRIISQSYNGFSFNLVIVCIFGTLFLFKKRVTLDISTVKYMYVSVRVWCDLFETLTKDLKRLKFFFFALSTDIILHSYNS